jgi:hypothetical protein
MHSPSMSMSKANVPPSSTVRLLAIVFGLVAVVGLGFATVSKQWLYNPRTVDYAQEVSFGPRGNVICEVDGECRALSNSELIDEWDAEVAKWRERAAHDPSEAMQKAAEQAFRLFRTTSSFPIFGWIALVGCAIGSLSLAVALALVLAKKRPHLPIMPTTTALLGIIVALFTGCIFVATKPGPAGFVGVSSGFIAFGAGIIAGIASALMLNKLLRPRDEHAAYWEPDNFAA